MAVTAAAEEVCSLLAYRRLCWPALRDPAIANVITCIATGVTGSEDSKDERAETKIRAVGCREMLSSGQDMAGALVNSQLSCLCVQDQTSQHPSKETGKRWVKFPKSYWQLSAAGGGLSLFFRGVATGLPQLHTPVFYIAPFCPPCPGALKTPTAPVRGGALLGSTRSLFLLCQR